MSDTTHEQLEPSTPNHASGAESAPDAPDHSSDPTIDQELDLFRTPETDETDPKLYNLVKVHTISRNAGCPLGTAAPIGWVPEEGPVLDFLLGNFGVYSPNPEKVPWYGRFDQLDLTRPEFNRAANADKTMEAAKRAATAWKPYVTGTYILDDRGPGDATMTLVYADPINRHSFTRVGDSANIGVFNPFLIVSGKCSRRWMSPPSQSETSKIHSNLGSGWHHSVYRNLPQNDVVYFWTKPY